MPSDQAPLFFNPFAEKKQAQHIKIECIAEKELEDWQDKQTEELKAQIKEQGFKAKSGETLIIREKGLINKIFVGYSDDAKFEDGAKIQSAISKAFSKETLEKTTFELTNTPDEHAQRLSIGWGWACYKFNKYKKDKDNVYPQLCISGSLDVQRITTFVESVCLIRDLVNTPANDMGPDELEEHADKLCAHHGVTLETIKDKELIKQNFPMIFDVGKASTRRPRLLDFSWGDEKHPTVTLVGKGVCFDTGGLDIKPSQFMLTMKKDMGGSAHVLGLAHMIMSLNLPIRLRVLIPAVENSIDGNAYRPSDILQSRKGITVEVGNTDAEGRLVLADALALACEEPPELLIDFATLTGAARVAVGFELPALFSNNDDTAYAIQKQSATDEVGDPVWNLPLWQPYRKELDSKVADISSTGGKAGASTAALFLQEFIDNDIEWIHMDVFAWEQKGKPGRPHGGADTGMRAIFAFLEDRYGKK